MYQRKYWQDHVTQYENRYSAEQDNGDGTVTQYPVEGEVIQEGTPQNAANFNNLEEGVLGAQMTANEAARVARELQRAAGGLAGEAITVTLANTQKYPFNNSQATVPLAVRRNTADYTVRAEVLSAAGGGVGDIDVSAKLTNGFKVQFNGAASSVALRLLVQGGI